MLIQELEGFRAGKQIPSSLMRELGQFSDKHQLILPSIFCRLQDLAKPIHAAAQKTPAPTYLLAAQEGTPRNSALAVRGNPYQRD